MADRASTVMGETPEGLSVINVYDNATKAFNLLKGLPNRGSHMGSWCNRDGFNLLVGERLPRTLEGGGGPCGFKLNRHQYTITQEVAIKLREFI
jgi:hypothetical protein